MKNIKIIISLCALLALGNVFGFELSSKDIVEGEKMVKTFEFKGFGCDGDNLSPQLAWKNPPKGTKSFAITAYDPDAPTGSGWWHWVAVNIPADVLSLEKGVDIISLGGLEVTNDFGSQHFGGACPPEKQGMHRYQFTVWALPTERLDVTKDSSAALVGFMLNGSALGKSKITSTYAR